VAASSTMYVCGRSLCEIADSYFADGMDVSSLVIFCVVQLEDVSATERSPSRGILPIMLCLHSLWSGATVTICTYSEYVEEGRINKREKQLNFSKRTKISK
jgi:hypothetical protein